MGPMADICRRWQHSNHYHYDRDQHCSNWPDERCRNVPVTKKLFYCRYRIPTSRYRSIPRGDQPEDCQVDGRKWGVAGDSMHPPSSILRCHPSLQPLGVLHSPAQQLQTSSQMASSRPLLSRHIVRPIRCHHSIQWWCHKEHHIQSTIWSVSLDTMQPQPLLGTPLTEVINL